MLTCTEREEKSLSHNVPSFPVLVETMSKICGATVQLSCIVSIADSNRKPGVIYAENFLSD
jgi:hypothetical protein